MMAWAGVMMSDIASIAWKVPDTIGVQGAHGMDELKQLCLNLPTLGGGVERSMHAVPPPA